MTALPPYPLKLPEYVRLCGHCNGAGEYEQNFTAGCGMGRFRAIGCCDYCRVDVPGRFGGRNTISFGLRYEPNGEEIRTAQGYKVFPESVIRQIEVMNPGWKVLP